MKCVKYRDTLHKRLHREKQRNVDEVVSPSSHTNYRYLQDIYSEGPALTEPAHSLQEYKEQAGASHVEDSTHNSPSSELFWEEQKKAAQCKDKHQVRWHPLIIKWCLYLRHQSSGAYETLRNSGVLRLPS